MVTLMEVQTKKFFIISTLLFLFMISFISAQEIRFTGEQNTAINITETCSFEEAPCSASFSCNITIEDPAQNIIVLNEPMTREDSIYFYELNESSTTIIGVYEVKRVSCTDGSDNNGENSFFFRITNTGAEQITSGKGLTILGTFLILMLATVFFLTFGILTKNIPFKIFFVSLSILLMVTTIGFSVATVQQVLGAFEVLVSTYGRFYILLTTLLIGGGIGLLIYLIVMALKSFDSTKHYFKIKDD